MPMPAAPVPWRKRACTRKPQSSSRTRSVPGGTIREPLLYLSCLVRQNQTQKARRAALAAMARLPAAEAARLAEVRRGAVAGGACSHRGGRHAWRAAKPGSAQTRAARGSPAGVAPGTAEDEVDRLLGGIPLRSPFGAMRLILKSLITPHDAAKARALLAMVPAGSIFAGVRDAAGSGAGGRAGPARHIGRGCARRNSSSSRKCAALPRDSAGLLNQILDAERRGPAALLSLLTRRGLPLPEDELRTACLNLLPAAPDRMAQFTQRFGPLPAIESQSGCRAGGGGAAGMG